MAEAHTTSDDTAITAAQDSLTAIASRVLLQRVEEHLRRPTRWSHEALVAASAAVWDRHVADMEAALGKAEGAFGGPIKPPVGTLNPHLITAAPHGERTPLPRVCAEVDGDCA